MRHGILWTVVVLGLPHVAAAAGTIGPRPAQAFEDHETAIERSSETPGADLPSTLDLRIVPPQPSPLQGPPADSLAPDADRVDRDSADAAAGRLSFGVELQRRRPFESRAWLDDKNAPGLQDDIQRLIDRSTLGVRGTYQF